MVFKVDPTGKETVLYAFTGGADGLGPSSGLVRDEAGNLYGTTILGGDLSVVCPPLLPHPRVRSGVQAGSNR